MTLLVAGGAYHYPKIAEKLIIGKISNSKMHNISYKK